jgi:hypothetical protein
MPPMKDVFTLQSANGPGAGGGGAGVSWCMQLTQYGPNMVTLYVQLPSYNLPGDSVLTIQSAGGPAKLCHKYHDEQEPRHDG